MISRLILLVIIATYPLRALAQYELPSSKKYWEFYNWYQSHSVISLVVSGNDKSHLDLALKELEKIRAKGVLVGDLMVIDLKAPEEEKPVNFLEKYGEPRINSAKAVVENFSIKNSPTWIIRHKGSNYIYEGLKYPSRLFNTEGKFNEAN